MRDVEHKHAIEAILFASGQPVPLSRICETLDIEPHEAKEAIESLMSSMTGGITIKRLDSSYQMCTSPNMSGVVRKALDIDKNTPLSGAAFEVLAAVAYNQPVTKAFVEQVRGVDCSGIISSLCQRGLLEEKGRLDLPGRPLLYGTTANFLRCFDLTTLADLPKPPNMAEQEEDLGEPESNE